MCFWLQHIVAASNSVLAAACQLSGTVRCSGGADTAQHVIAWAPVCSTQASLLLKRNDLLRLLEVQVSASADLYKAQVGEGTGMVMEEYIT